MTRPLTFLAWYKHFNKMCRGKGRSMGVGDGSLAQGTIQNLIEN